MTEEQYKKREAALLRRRETAKAWFYEKVGRIERGEQSKGSPIRLMRQLVEAMGFDVRREDIDAIARCCRFKEETLCNAFDWVKDRHQHKWLNFDHTWWAQLKELEYDYALFREKNGRLHLDEPLDRYILEMDGGVRAMNCLKSAGIYCADDLCQYTVKELLRLKNFGKKNIGSLKDFLSEYGLRLGMTEEELNEYRTEFLL